MASPIDLYDRPWFAASRNAAIDVINSQANYFERFPVHQYVYGPIYHAVRPLKREIEQALNTHTKDQSHG